MASSDLPAQLQESLSGRYEIDREIGAGGMATVYLAGGKLMAAGISVSPAFVVTSREALVPGLFRSTGQQASFDVSRDGKTFLMLGRGDTKERAVVVTGWLDELKERMAMAAKK